MAMDNVILCGKVLFMFLVYFHFFTFEAEHRNINKKSNDALSSFIENLITCRNNVGLSIALVHSGENVFTKGFGYRNLFKEQPMTPDTKINIGSLTKSFTSTLVADSVAKNLTGWNTPVIDLLGTEFKLEGSFRTQQACFQDILAHRLGMLSYWGASTAGLNFTRKELCMNRLRYFDALYEFRSEWLYSNYPYVLAGYVLEELAGIPWEEQVNSLFQRLGMSDTRHASSLTDEDWELNTAFSYIFTNGQYKQIDEQAQLPFLEKISPAGGIFSTANDMSKYMRFHLSGGKDARGKQIIPKDVLSAEYRSSNAIPTINSIRVPLYPVDDTSFAYGLGWYIGTYRGRNKIFHTGSYSGYNCMMTLLPDEDTGVWACVNGPGDGSISVQLANSYALDLLLGEDPWLNDTTACTFPAPWEPEYKLPSPAESELSSHSKTRRTNSNSDVNISKDLYVGEYIHPGFGTFSVTTDSTSKLRCKLGILLRGVLNDSNETGKFYLILDPPLDYRMTFFPEYPQGFPTNFIITSELRVDGVYLSYLEFSLPPFFSRI